MRTHFKPTEIFVHKFYTMCHPPGTLKGFVKGENLRLLQINSSKEKLKRTLDNSKYTLTERDYPKNIVDKPLSLVKFERRKRALL